MFNPEPRKPLVVVEIGNDWLKIAESRYGALGRSITKTRFIRLAEIKGPVSETIAKVFKELKLGKHSVITYIPRHLVNVRILELPSTDPDEIKDMVNLQVGKQTPYSKEEIVSAHKIIDTEKEGYIKAMLVIAKRNIVTDRVEALEKSGVDVESVGLSSEGAYNWFNATCPAAIKESYLAPVILVDIDSKYSDFMAIYKGKLTFTRNIFIGANNITEPQSQWQEKFIEELKRSLERYQTEGRATRPSKMFLSGAAKNIKALDQVLGAKLDIPAEVIDPARNIRIKKNLSIVPGTSSGLISTSSLFGVALGHEKLELDLTPAEARIHKLMEEKRRTLTVMGVLFLSIAMIGSSLLLADIYNKSIYLRQLKRKISRIEKTADEARRMRLRIDLVEKRLDAKGSSINILNEIHKLTPKEIYFTGINIEEKRQAILKGRALAMSDVFRFVTTVEESAYFKDAKTTYTTTKKEEGIEYADFEIICSYDR